MQRAADALIFLLLLASAGSVCGIYSFPPDCPPGMAIKARVARSVRPGKILTYTVRVKNSGRVPIQNLYIEADLPNYVTYPVPGRPGPSYVLGPGPSYVLAPKRLTFDQVTVGAGNVVVLENVGEEAVIGTGFMGADSVHPLLTDKINR